MNQLLLGSIHRVVLVQAADRGNFASRLSHSCGPNCRNVATTVGGARITNALFTTRHIAAGEELCWDYACVTESEKEFRAAVCLCGTPTCRGSFLYFANSSTFQMVPSHPNPSSSLLETSLVTNVIKIGNLRHALPKPHSTPVTRMH